ncbi:hypothetical protein [Streptomyces sp. NPDC020298]|uniref:hypothetical protein n=1 Tax=unclassified Streptomyces TaxID=2593676 RepID=UPI0033F3CA02
MYDLIRRLVHWLALLLGPGTGTRRAVGTRPRRHRPAPLTPDFVCLPLHRSLYGLHLLLDGTENRLARPYLTTHAHEREQRALRSRRRLAFVLAADFGIDLDQHVVGAEKVAA